jgi:diguanylate cyclase (GGDEF)-like protein/PAS domain S-box-containing protein
MSGLNVLMVEDSPLDAELIVRALRRNGLEFAIRRVEDEAGLLEAIEAFAPDVILSDFALPRLGGGRALALALERAPHVPFIFVSGAIGEEAAIEALKVGATDYVLKGNLARLPAAVERAVDEARGRRAHRDAEEARRRSERRFRALVEHSADAILLLDEQGALRYATPASARVLGRALDERIGRDFFELLLPEDAAALRARNARAKPRVPEGFECRIAGGESGLRVLEGVMTNLLDDPAVAAVVVNCRDVTERKRAEEELARLARLDALTGLPNRHLFNDRLERAIAQARRYGWQVGVMYIDLDDLKPTNDRLGHAAGDRLLLHVAYCLRASVRAGDTVARLGGDEFAVILSVIGNAEDAGRVASKLSGVLAQPVTINGHAVKASASVGIALFPRDAPDPDALLRDADQAMYQAKREGGGRYRFYSGAERGPDARVS